jgi:hypothetical protein
MCIYNKTSFFIYDKAIFGSYPTQLEVLELEKKGYNWFVNVTSDNERHITPYQTTTNYINFPIPDHKTPNNKETFTSFIYKLFRILVEYPSSKMFIHCKGGHGRSGIVVATLCCLCFDMKSVESLSYTNKCHLMRKEMRDVWRHIGSPQTIIQKDFVRSITNEVEFSISDFNNVTRFEENTYDTMTDLFNDNHVTEENAWYIVHTIYHSNVFFRNWVRGTYLGTIINSTGHDTLSYITDSINLYKLYYI